MTDLVLPQGMIRGRVIVEVAKFIRDFGPAPAYEITRALDLNRQVIGKCVHRLYDAKAVFVREWIHPDTSNCLSPVWEWRSHSRQRDAKRPERKPRRQINIDWNARHAAYRSVKQRLDRGTTPSVWAGLL